MIKRQRPKIYSQYEIDIIIFYASMIFFSPLILVFTYLFEIDKVLNINTYMFWLLIINFAFMIIGTIIFSIKRDYLKRRVKATYRNEFYFLMFLVIFGLLGFLVIYEYLGGNKAYIANILVILFAILVYLVVYLGKRFFKFDYIRKQ